MEEQKKLEVMAALEAFLKLDKDQASLYGKLLQAGKNGADPMQLQQIYQRA